MRQPLLFGTLCLIGLNTLHQVILNDASCLLRWQSRLARASDPGTLQAACSPGTVTVAPAKCTKRQPVKHGGSLSHDWHPSCHRYTGISVGLPLEGCAPGNHSAAVANMHMLLPGACQLEGGYMYLISDMASKLADSGSLQQQTPDIALCLRHPLWAHMHCLYLITKRVSSYAAAAVTAHPADIGLSVALLLPQVLAAVMLADALLAGSQHRQQQQQHSQSGFAAAVAGMAGTLAAPHSIKAASTNTGQLSSTLAGSIWASYKHTIILAAAKLLPAAAGVLVALVGHIGLLQLHTGSSSQYLLLQHCCTPWLTAALTLFSQARPLDKAVLSVLHVLMAWLLSRLGSSSGHNSMATIVGPNTSGWQWPALQAMLLLDVVMPCVAYALRWFQAAAATCNSSEPAKEHSSTHSEANACAPAAQAAVNCEGVSLEAAADVAADAVCQAVRIQPVQHNRHAPLGDCSGFDTADCNKETGDATIQLVTALRCNRPASALKQVSQAISKADSAVKQAVGALSSMVSHTDEDVPAAAVRDQDLCVDDSGPDTPHGIEAVTIHSADALSIGSGPNTSTTLAIFGAAGLWELPQQQLHQLQQAAPAPQPVVSLDQALTACVRGASPAARLHSGRSALYRSHLQHHIISIKVPMGQAEDSQQLVSMLTQHFAKHNINVAGQDSLAADMPGDDVAAVGAVVAGGMAAVQSQPLLLLPPVAISGCFHLLLALAAVPGAAGMFSLPLKDLLHELQGNKQHQSSRGSSSNMQAIVSQNGSPATAAHSQLQPKFTVQVNQQAPVPISKRRDGSWYTVDADCKQQLVQDQAGASANAANTAVNAACWSLLPCISLQAVSSPSSPATPECELLVVDVPAAAMPAVRAVVVQGSQVVADKVVRLDRQQGQPPTQAQKAPGLDGRHQEAQSAIARLALPRSQLQAGPALVYLLTPSPVTPDSKPMPSMGDTSNAPSSGPLAAGSIAASLQALKLNPSTTTVAGPPWSGVGHSATASTAQPSARVWACLPVLLVGSAAAEEQLLCLFDDMVAELQQEQQQQHLQKQHGNNASVPNGASALASGPLSAGRDIASLSLHNAPTPVVMKAHQQHWQPMLWDWHHAVHATDTSCISNVTALAAKLQISARILSTAAAAHQTSSLLHNREVAAPAARHSTETYTGAAGRESATVAANVLAAARALQQAAGSDVLHARHQLGAQLLTLLTQQGYWQAAEELLKHVQQAAASETIAASSTMIPQSPAAGSSKEGMGLLPPVLGINGGISSGPGPIAAGAGVQAVATGSQGARPQLNAGSDRPKRLAGCTNSADAHGLGRWPEADVATPAGMFGLAAAAQQPAALHKGWHTRLLQQQGQYPGSQPLLDPATVPIAPLGMATHWGMQQSVWQQQQQMHEGDHGRFSHDTSVTYGVPATSSAPAAAEQQSPSIPWSGEGCPLPAPESASPAPASQAATASSGHSHTPELNIKPLFRVQAAAAPDMLDGFASVPQRAGFQTAVGSVVQQAFGSKTEQAGLPYTPLSMHRLPSDGQQLGNAFAAVSGTAAQDLEPSSVAVADGPPAIISGCTRAESGMSESSSRWHVFDTTGLENYIEELEPPSPAPPSASRNRKNSIASTTWLAIPTSGHNAQAVPSAQGQAPGLPGSGAAAVCRGRFSYSSTMLHSMPVEHSVIHYSSATPARLAAATPGVQTPALEAAAAGRPTSEAAAGSVSSPLPPAVGCASRHMMLFSPVRDDSGSAAAVPAGKYQRPHRGNGGSRHDAAPWGGSHDQHATSSRGIAAAAAGQSSSLMGHGTRGPADVSGSLLPPLPMLHVPSKGNLLLPDSGGGANPYSDHLKAIRSMGNVVNRVPHQPHALTHGMLSRDGHAVSVLDSRASNTTRATNRDTVSGVLELLSGSINVASAALYSDRVLSSSGSGNLYDTNETLIMPRTTRALAPQHSSPAGGYFTPVKPRSRHCSDFGLQPRHPAVRASMLGRQSSTVAAAAGMSTAARAVVTAPKHQGAETPVTGAGKSIGQAVFSPDAGNSMSGAFVGTFISAVSGGLGTVPEAGSVLSQPAGNPIGVMTLMSRQNAATGQSIAQTAPPQQQQTAGSNAQPTPAGAGANLMNAFMTGSIAAPGNSTNQQQLQLAQQGSCDDYNTPVQTPHATSPWCTPPDQIIHDPSVLWNAPGAGSGSHDGHPAPFNEDLTPPVVSAAGDTAGAAAGPRQGLSTAACCQPNMRSRAPPPAPARPIPSVMLVPAFEAIPSESCSGSSLVEHEDVCGVVIG